MGATCVSDTNTFTLENVATVVYQGSVVGGENLVQLFSDAASGTWDPSYVGSKDRLSNFRNWCLCTAPTDPTSITPYPTDTFAYFCPGGSCRLTVQGGSLGTNGRWYWWYDGCTRSSGGKFSASGSTTTYVDVNVAGDYYVNAIGDCGTSGCAGITVAAYTSSTAYTTVTTSCTGGRPSLWIATASGGSDGSNSGNNVCFWYSNSACTTLVHSGNAWSGWSPSTNYWVRRESLCGNSLAKSWTSPASPSPC